MKERQQQAKCENCVSFDHNYGMCSKHRCAVQPRGWCYEWEPDKQDDPPGISDIAAHVQQVEQENERLARENELLRKRIDYLRFALREAKGENQIDAIAKEIHACAKEKGWWEGDRQLPELIALMHSELSEALEHYRTGNPDVFDDNGKPDGVAIELVDCMIRILDTLVHRGHSVGELIRKKTEYNEGREYRHGGKKA